MKKFSAHPSDMMNPPRNLVAEFNRKLQKGTLGEFLYPGGEDACLTGLIYGNGEFIPVPYYAHNAYISLVHQGDFLSTDQYLIKLSDGAWVLSEDGMQLTEAQIWKLVELAEQGEVDIVTSSYAAFSRLLIDGQRPDDEMMALLKRVLFA